MGTDAGHPESRKHRHVECLLSTDDEAYTYNRRVNYLSTVSEHHMILRALEHNTEAQIAEALDVDVATIREKCRLLNGVCKEAIEILKEKRVNPKAFSVLRKMKPVRQVEAAQLMVASNMFSGRFAAALLAGTRDELLVSPSGIALNNQYVRLKRPRWSLRLILCSRM
jgi:hypothetical protein